MITDKDTKPDIGILISVLPLLSVFTVILPKILSKADLTDILKIGIITFLLTTAVVFYIRLHSGFHNIKYANIITAATYIISILLIMLSGNPITYSFWMLGGLVNAMLVDKILGLLIYFNLTFILNLSYLAGPETIINCLIMGVLFILLSDALKNKATVIYASIILLSTDITLTFVLNNFIFDTKVNTNYLASFFSLFAVLVAAFVISVLYGKFCENDSDSNSKIIEIETENEITQDKHENVITETGKSTGANYDILLSEDNELMMRLKNHSEKTYNHCRMIGDLSGRAARLIGADENLARAGGYYHEIGKISGNNYIEEGLKLADEYAFPGKLKDIIRQHNIKHDKPTFIEAAIVMISDNVATTIEYINKTGEQKFSPDKIIDDIFRMRMEKGTFDESGLTVKDFKLLKEFFQNEFKTKGLTDKEENN